MKQMDNKRIYYIGLNLIAPGIGQFALGKWIRGTIMFLGTLGLCAWFIYLVFSPLYHNISIALSGDEGKELIQIDWIRIIAVFVAMTLAWLWSIVDVFFIKIPDDKNNE